MKIDLKENERIDELQRNGYQIIQNKGAFCFGMDAVLLAGFSYMRPGEKALDLGTGTGIIPILMEGRTHREDNCPGMPSQASQGSALPAAEVVTAKAPAPVSLVGLEIQDRMVDMASRSVAMNGLQERISIVKGDIKDVKALFAGSSFDVVTSNPPYMNDAHGLKNPDMAKAIARHEVLCTLEDVVAAAAYAVKPGGRFYMVHRPHRLAEIIVSLCSHGLEPKRMKFVHPYVDKEPNMVLIEAVRGGNPMVKVEKPLIVFQEPGVYTEEIREIYGY